jgi:Mn2+/Fe2+ NRAMP family transporter
MVPSPSPPHRPVELLRIIGPGLVVAATGVGAGDLVAAAKAGATYGLPVLWAVLVGSGLKFALAEGVARWQLSTGTTVLEGWVRLFGRPVQVLFLVYLLLWTFVVGGALMAATGLVAHALIPALPVAAWGVLHALAAFLFVWVGGYLAFEAAMKWAVGAMFVAIVGTAALQAPPLAETLAGLVVPRVPGGSTLLVLGMIGGVGGTVTLLSYNYWIRERGWEGPSWIRGVRLDLATGYVLTGLFGVALVVLAGEVLHPRGIRITGSAGVLEMAGVLGHRFGRAGELVLLAGFWAAVATSMFGVWQGVPYLFADYVALVRSRGRTAGAKISPRDRQYRWYLLFLTFPPMTLLAIGKPVWLVVGYAFAGALFMPFLAATLLAMNNRRREMGELRNGHLANAALVICLGLFLALLVVELDRRLAGG